MSRLTSLLCVVAMATVAVSADPKPVSVNKRSAPAPAGWLNEEPDNRLRSFQFKLASSSEDKSAGEVYVMPNSNPDSKKYFTRWQRDFVLPDGKTYDDISKASEIDLGGGTTAHLLDVTGTWRYKARPFDPRSKTEERADYRVVWAVVVGPDETSHLRMSGPKAVIDKQYDAFVNWLKALQ